MTPTSSNNARVNTIRNGSRRDGRSPEPLLYLVGVRGDRRTFFLKYCADRYRAWRRGRKFSVSAATVTGVNGCIAAEAFVVGDVVRVRVTNSVSADPFSDPLVNTP